jgi:hypothetical protein
MPRAETYQVTVEALKPPDSDLDDETREELNESREGLKNDHSSSDKADAAGSEEPELVPAPSSDDEPTQNGDSTDKMEGLRPKKKRRRS